MVRVERFVQCSGWSVEPHLIPAALYRDVAAVRAGAVRVKDIWSDHACSIQSVVSGRAGRGHGYANERCPSGHGRHPRHTTPRTCAARPADVGVAFPIGDVARARVAPALRLAAVAPAVPPRTCGLGGGLGHGRGWDGMGWDVCTYMTAGSCRTSRSSWHRCCTS
jgi:hypothetical protein